MVGAGNMGRSGGNNGGVTILTNLEGQRYKRERRNESEMNGLMLNCVVDWRTDIIISQFIIGRDQHIQYQRLANIKKEQMQNTTNAYSQNQNNNSLASKNNGTGNQQSPPPKNTGSNPSNIFSRNVVTKPQANLPSSNTNPLGPALTMTQILNNTVGDKFKPVNSNPTNPLGHAPNNFNTQSRSNPFHGTINQSTNSSNALNIFNQKPSNNAQPNTANTFNTSSPPFGLPQKPQYPSNIFSKNQLAPTFTQTTSNLAFNNTNLQTNQTPANLNQLFSKNTNVPTFLPSNRPTTNFFSNHTTTSTADNAFFTQSSFQPNMQQAQQQVTTMQTDPNKDNPFTFFNIKLILCQIQDKTNKYCDSRLDEIDPSLKQRKISGGRQIFELLSAMIQIKITGDSLRTLKEQMDDLGEQSQKIRVQLQARLASKKNNGLVEKLKWRKMLEDIQEELTLIEDQLYNFIKPLYVAHQSKRSITFEDPDTFSIKVAQSLQKKMLKVSASIHELSSEALTSAQVILDLEQANSKEAHAVIAKLTEHFEEICMKFELLKERYIQQRKPSTVENLRQGQAIQGREKSESLRIENFMRTISKVLEDRNETIERRFSKSSMIPSTQ